jgi:hypothetical protein
VVVVGDDGDGLAVVPDDHPRLRVVTGRLEAHAVADDEARHLVLRPGFLHELQTRHDPAAQLHPLGFGQFADVDVQDRAVPAAGVPPDPACSSLGGGVLGV